MARIRRGWSLGVRDFVGELGCGGPVFIRRLFSGFRLTIATVIRRQSDVHPICPPNLLPLPQVSQTISHSPASSNF